MLFDVCIVSRESSRSNSTGVHVPAMIRRSKFDSSFCALLQVESAVVNVFPMFEVCTSKYVCTLQALAWLKMVLVLLHFGTEESTNDCLREEGHEGVEER